MGIRELLIPHDTVFYDLFEKQAGIVTEAAWLLVDLTENFTNVKEKRHAIEKLEHKGDVVTHDIYEQLNRTFITPLDPEEISRLAQRLMRYWIISTGRQRRCSIIPLKPPMRT